MLPLHAVVIPNIQKWMNDYLPVFQSERARKTATLAGLLLGGLGTGAAAYKIGTVSIIMGTAVTPTVAVSAVLLTVAVVTAGIIFNRMRLQQTAREFLDCAEFYFRGDGRLDTRFGYLDYLGEAIRYASFATVVLPIFFSIGALFASLLIKTDESTKEYWEQRVTFPRAWGKDEPKGHFRNDHFYESERKKIYEAFQRSGIAATSFKKILFVRVSDHGHAMICSADGLYARFTEYEEIEAKDFDKVLLLFVYEKMFMSQSYKKFIHQQMRDANKKTMRESVYGVLSLFEFYQMSYLGALPHAVKQLVEVPLDAADPNL